jgi:hypothetical protein
MAKDRKKARPDDAPLTDYEHTLMRRLFSEWGEIPAAFKSAMADYTSVNGSLHVSSMPTLKGEEWREVGAAGQPAFAGTWVNYGSTYDTAAFYKDPLGRVHIKGLVKDGTVHTTVFTLPDGYKPTADLLFVVTSNDAFAVLTVRSSGAVAHSAGGSNVYLQLNVSFRAA